MPSVTISRSDGGSGPVPPNAEFTLQARLSDGEATAWKWQRNGEDVPDAQSSELPNQKASAETVGSFVAIATVDLEPVRSEPFEVKLKPADAPGGASPAPKEPTEAPPEFYRLFACVSLLVAAAVAGVVLYQPAHAAWQVAKGDWKGTDGHLQLAASLGVPLTVLGGAAVAAGAWMAAVEWRGRFKKRPKKKKKWWSVLLFWKKEEEEDVARTRGVDVDVGEVIKAIGNLRGAALVMVVGALLMLGSAWVAQSSADQPATTTTNTTPTTPPPPPPPPPGSGG